MHVTLETLEIFALKLETGGKFQNHHHYSASLEILANMLSKKKKKKAIVKEFASNVICI